MKVFTNIVRKYISILTIFVLLFSGIGFNQLEAESSFFDATNTTSPTICLAASEELTSSAPCTLEMLGQTPQLAACHTPNLMARRITEPTNSVFVVLLFFLAGLLFLISWESVFYPHEVYTIITIIRYIHNEDGKK